MYLANPHEFEPVRLSRCERVEHINKIFDKLADFLQKVPQVTELPVGAREARLRAACDFLANQLQFIDGNRDGNIPAGGLILLLTSNLKALSIAETRLLAEYVIE